MRVISGQAKSKALKVVPGKGTRPIADRVKTSLFNILEQRVPGCRFLDLFAGTGGVGIEALSRGAEQAIFVERAFKAVRVLRENLQRTGMAEQAQVWHEDVFRFIAKIESTSLGQFDIIYVAPPQYQKLWSRTLVALDAYPLLAPGGVIAVQIFPKEYETLELKQFTLSDRRTYGSTMLCFYEHVANAGPG